MTRRRLAAALATCSLAIGGATALTASAAAVADVSINGPATAGYYTLADIQGTAAADSTVQLFVQRAGDSGFSPGQTAQVDGSGQYEIQLRIIRTSTYYVQDGSEQSPTITTRQYTASCSVGDPQLTHLPLGRSHASDPYTQNFAAFTASRGRTFAGVAGRFNYLAVIVRRPDAPVKILHTFNYSNVVYSPASGASLDVAGVTPDGAVVASAQNTGTNDGSRRFTSYIWLGGKAETLGGPANWVSTYVTGVSDEGYIVGTARIHTSGSPLYRVVIWDSKGDEVFAHSTGHMNPSPVLDGNDDLAFTNSDSYAQVVRMAGDQHELRAYPLTVDRSSSIGIQATAASKDSIFGPVQQTQAIMRWAVPQSGGSEPLVGTAVAALNDPFAADDAGDLLTGNFTPSHLQTAAGAVATLPSQAIVDVDHTAAGSTIASSGAVSFSSAKDHLPHLFHCTTVET